MNPENLQCIDLDQPALEGFRQFISCWLYRDENLALVVDPGPLSTIPHLRQALEQAGIDRLDFILLTHIHIDHAGGTGALLENYPEARVICHPKGVEHMVAPDKLWQGSRKVLGELAEIYGEIIPIPAEQISSAEGFSARDITAYLTPGHAQHHCSYRIDDLLFGGEVAGVRYPLEHGIYLRPATPPRFIREVALDSLAQMIALQTRYLVIAHYGLVEPAVDYLRIAYDQLNLWTRGLSRFLDRNGHYEPEEILAWLQREDRAFATFPQLPPDIQQRERFFLNNTLAGMQDFLFRQSTGRDQKQQQSA